MLGRTNTGGGGSGGLNFQVIGGTTAPSNPKENMIWVNTSTKITSYIFSATQPTGSAGMVWIYTGTSSATAFNALKKNSITVYPISAKQYENGAWVNKTAKTYQDGKWVNWYLVLFSANINVGFTPYKGTNGNVTINANSIVLNYTAEQNGWACVSTTNPVNLSNYSKFTVRMNCSKYYSKQDFGGHVAVGTKALSSTNYGNSTELTAKTRITTTGKYVDYSVDISSLRGSYYLGVWGVVAGTITDIWLE